MKYYFTLNSTGVGILAAICNSGVDIALDTCNFVAYFFCVLSSMEVSFLRYSGIIYCEFSK